ncbi:PIN domain-containing protein [Candidatus Woesearchaeota archaeon]|nr:PIN domain-containing protein [Candidatus Woesearchaeota archaeon]
MSDEFVLDAFAWVEYFLGSKRGEKVKGFIEINKCITPTIVIAELSAKYSGDEIDFKNKLKFIKFNTKVMVLSDEIAEAAGKIRINQRKIKKDFGLVDSIIYATALSIHAKVLSGDPHFQDIQETIMI